MLNFFSEHFIFYLMLCSLLGLVLGSFLNMLCYRLPIMLHESWRKESREFLALSVQPAISKLNFFTPRSHCVHCKTVIAWRYNIPVFSYLFLRGKCAYCRQKIALRYLFLELLGGLLSFIVAWHFGVTWQTGAALIFTGLLLALSYIDMEHQLLPDVLTFTLLWLGLLISLVPFSISSGQAIAGATAGYLSLWLIAFVFNRVTGKTGMGHGDFKLCAALGAWLGWQSLPLILLISSLFGLIAGIILLRLKNQDRNAPIPFGPFLALAGWLMLIWGTNIINIF